MSPPPTHLNSENLERPLIHFHPRFPCANHQQDSESWKIKVCFEYLSTLHHPCYSHSKALTSSASTAHVASGLPAPILPHFHLIFLKADREISLKM